jgi:tyrosinase
VVDTTASPLNYRYDDETAPVAVPRLTRRLKRFGAPQPMAAAPWGKPVDVAKRRTPEPIGGSEGPVQLAGATSVAIRLDAAPTRTLRANLDRAAATARTASAQAEQPAEPPRVFLKLEGIRGTSDAANYHVYVGLPAQADPAEHQDRLAGVVSLFGVSAASDPNGPTAGSGINQVLEVTDMVDALHLSGDDLSRLNVRFVPATPAAERANVSIRRMSVFKLGD